MMMTDTLPSGANPFEALIRIKFQLQVAVELLKKDDEHSCILELLDGMVVDAEILEDLLHDLSS